MAAFRVMACRGLRVSLVASCGLAVVLLAASATADAESRKPAQTLKEIAAQAEQRAELQRGLLDQVMAVLMQPAEAAPAARSRDEDADERPVPPAPVNTAPARGSVEVNPTGAVELHVSNMPVTDVLRMIAERTRRNIVASKGVVGTVSADLYQVTLEQALDAILSAHGFAYRREGDFIHVYTREELTAILRAERQLTSRVFRLRYITAKDAESILAPCLSKDGKISVTPPADSGLGSSNTSGGTTGGQGTGGDNHANVETLVVVDYPEHIQQVARVLKELDVKPRQVLVEATILRAQLNEDNALGIDFTTVGGIDFTELSSVSPGVQSITTGLVPPAKLQETTLTARTDFAGNVPGGGFTFGVIKDQIGVFIRALEQITDTTVLANPKILALNKQKGEVIVGRRDGYLTTTITETTAIQTVEFLETGTRLIFRPYIYDDDTIRMEIHPEDSTGGVTAANLPFKQTTEVTTNIMVRDGHTILIGGLFREVDSAVRGQIPFLGNIPGAGALFRSTNDGMTREEIIILLTVHIIKSDEDNAAGQKLIDDIERYRIGQRRSAQWFGRERISQTHYRWALEHLARGDVGRALWDAALSIRTNPRQLQAFELQEKVRRRRAWDEECSAVRHMLRELIAREVGAAVTPYQRPAPPFQMPEGFEGPSGVEPEDIDSDESAPPTATTEEVGT